MKDFIPNWLLFTLIGLVMGNPTRFNPDHLLTGSCNFDTDLCGYSGLSGKTASWFQINTTTDNHGLSPSTDGHYAYFKSNVLGIHNNETGSLVSPKLNIDGCIDVEFDYILPYRQLMTLSIKLQESGTITHVISITGHDMKSWIPMEENVCVKTNSQIIFETTKLSYYAYVGIDNIRLTLAGSPEPTTTQQPASTTQQPMSTTQQPASTTQQPWSTTQQPASTTQQPASTTQQAMSTTRQPIDEIRRLWYSRDIERLELEKQKLHLEIKLLKDQLIHK